MNIDELQSVRDRERQTDKPQQLRESFYADVGSLVEQLRTERDRAAERHNSPYADEVTRLTDEIDAAQQLVEDIHERRIGKIVKAASLEAAELSPEVDGLTTEEQRLFGQLVADIEDHREDVLATVEGDEPDPEGGNGDHATETTGSSDATGTSAADVMGSDSGPTGTGTAGRTNQDSTRSEHPDPGELRRDSARETPAPDDRTTTTNGATNGHHSGDQSDTMARDDPEAEGPATEPDSTTRSGGGREAATTNATADGGSRPDSPDETASAGPRSNGTDGTASAGPRSNGTDGPASAGSRSNGTDGTAAGESRVDAQQGETGQAETGDQQESGPPIGGEVDRERVLVTQNVETFVGFDDRDYDLAAEDVVTLPSTNAEILVERDAARRL